MAWRGVGNKTRNPIRTKQCTETEIDGMQINRKQKEKNTVLKKRTPHGYISVYHEVCASHLIFTPLNGPLKGGGDA